MSTPSDSPVIDGIRIIHRWTDQEDGKTVHYSDIEKTINRLNGKGDVVISTPVVELTIDQGPLNGGSAVILDDSWLAQHLAIALVETFWKAVSA